MKQPMIESLNRQSIFALAVLVFGLGAFGSGCSESVMLAPVKTDIEEDDAFAKAMQLPAASDGERFVIVEQMPKLVGGLKGLQENFRYPVPGCPDTIQGRIFLQFTVGVDGSTSQIIVVRSMGDEYTACDAEAIRVVQEARFVPGVQAGERVPVKMSLPITIKSDNPQAQGIQAPLPSILDPIEIRKQIDNGTYQFDSRNWSIVADASIEGTAIDREGIKLESGIFLIPKFRYAVQILDGQYFMRLPYGTWTVLIAVDDKAWEETITLGKGEQLKRDFREPVE